MNLYVVMGKYSQDYISGLIYKPQDRKKASLTMMKKAVLNGLKAKVMYILIIQIMTLLAQCIVKVKMQ